MALYPNRQAIFDKAYTGLAAQGFKQASKLLMEGFDTTVCQYKTPDGCKCAVGHLIPDELYSEELEVGAYSQLQRHFPGLVVKLVGALDMRDETFIENLQWAHDRNPDPATMKAALEAVARSCKLTIPNVEAN